jgi:hypothetical protein
VVGEDAGVEHVGVGDNDVTGGPHGPPRRRRGVPVVGEGLDVEAQEGDEVVNLVHLVLSQSLGGEEVEGSGLGAPGDLVQDRQVVAEGFPRSRGGDDDHVPPGVDGFQGLGLV